GLGHLSTKPPCLEPQTAAQGANALFSESLALAPCSPHLPKPRTREACRVRSRVLLSARIARPRRLAQAIPESLVAEGAQHAVAAVLFQHGEVGQRRAVERSVLDEAVL